jgi:hypothetical protein
LDVEGDSFPPQAAAAYFHRCGIRRDDVDYILETFPIVKRKDKQAHGAYRTKRVILDIHDAMQQAMETGTALSHALRPTARIRLDTAGHHAGGGNGTTE